MTFDPRQLGCLCDDCPLNGNKPVPPEPHPKPKLVILGEAPGKNEELEGKPFVGASGFFLRQTFKRFGMKREDFHITNTLLCRPHRRLEPKEWKAAIEACRPRLERELNAEDPDSGSHPIRVGGDTGVSVQSDRRPLVLACGAKALQVTTGRAVIKDWIGAPVESPFGTVLPTFHPAHVLRKPAFGPVFRLLFQRALKLAEGKLPAWQWPPFHTEPTPAMEEALAQIGQARSIGVDIETNSRDADQARITMVGFATPSLAVSVPYPYPTPELDRLATSILADPGVEKVLHNGFGYDLYVFRRHGIAVRGPIFDTLLASVVVAPELPHDLGFVVACELHAPRWKTARGLDEMGEAEYNCKDCITTVLLRSLLASRLDATHNGWALFQQYQELAQVAARMRWHGMTVDRSRFANHRKRLQDEMDDAADKFKSIVGPSYKLGAAGQHKDLHRLFFNDFHITPRYRNEDTGSPQLNAKALGEIVTGAGSQQAAQAAEAVLRFRKAAKLISTYLDGLTKSNVES